MLSVLLHVVEFAAILGVAAGVAYFFPERREEVLGVVSILLSLVAKSVRTFDEIPVEDYVNAPLRRL